MKVRKCILSGVYEFEVVEKDESEFNENIPKVAKKIGVIYENEEDGERVSAYLTPNYIYFSCLETGFLIRRFLYTGKLNDLMLKNFSDEVFELLEKVGKDTLKERRNKTLKSLKEKGIVIVEPKKIEDF